MKKISKKKIELIKRIVTYTVMAVSVCVTVIVITLLVLGFRLNVNDRQVEQYAFLQFSSTPAGATITIDGQPIASKTPSKSSVKEGSHKIEIQKTGYSAWSKEVNVKAGTLTWLNYALLVPKVLTVEPIMDFDKVHSSLPSPRGRGLIVQHSIESPYFSLIDVTPVAPKVTELTLPPTVYSEPFIDGVVHTFSMKKWDDAGRYLLIEHTFSEKNEWIVLDTQNISLSKNISTLFNIPFNEIDFSGTNGNSYFILQSGDIRKLNIANGTISKVLVSNVASMFVYDTNIIVFVGNSIDGAKEKYIGVFREGDDNPYTIRTIPNEDDLPISVATAHYFNQDYIAYSVGQEVNVIGGKYPNTFGDGSKTLDLISVFQSEGEIIELGFSPTGQYVISQSVSSVTSFDIEYQIINKASANCGDTKLPFKWLNDNYFWSICDGSLDIREFDGVNHSTIGPAVNNQAVVLTHNGRYIYSIGEANGAYQLQRVRMILP